MNNQVSLTKDVSKLNNAKLCLIVTVIMSIVNVIALNFGVYFLYSSFLATLIVEFGYEFASAYGSNLYIVICSILAILTLVPYFLSWLFCKKHPAWLVVSLALFILDTLILAIFSFEAFALGDLSFVLDFIFHIIIIVELAIGVKAAFNLKKAAKMQEEAQTFVAQTTNEEVTVNETANEEVTEEVNELANQTRVLTLTRKFNFLGCAIPFVVYVNGQVVGNIACGKEQTFTVPASAFKLSVTLSNGLSGNEVLVEEGLDPISYQTTIKAGLLSNTIEITKL